MDRSGNKNTGGTLTVRRLIAGGFDTVSLFLLFMLLVFLLNLTPLSRTARGHLERCREIQQRASEELGGDAEAVRQALSRDTEYREELFAAQLHNYLLQAAACAAAEGILFLAVPLANSSRATFGMLLTGTGVFDPSGWTWAPPWKIIMRFLFILFLDSLLLYPWTGTLTFLLVPVLRIIQLMLGKKGKTIIDHLTGTEIAETAERDTAGITEE